MKKYFRGIVLTVVLLVSMSATVMANLVTINSVYNSGELYEKSINGKYGVPKFNGVFAKGGVATNGGYYYAKERFTSFSERVPKDSKYKLEIKLSGYHEGTIGNTGQGRSNVSLYYENKLGGWTHFDTLQTLGYVGNNGIPVYLEEPVKLYNLENFKDLPTEGLWRVRATTDGHCIDAFRTNIIYDNAPKMEWATPKNEQYLNGSDYWYKVGAKIDLENTFSDKHTDLMNMYGYLYEGNNLVYKVGVASPGKNSWVDNIDNNKIYEASGKYIAGEGKQVHNRFSLKAKGDYDLKYKVQAVNTEMTWADPSRKETEPIDTGFRVRTDGAAPTGDNFRVLNKTTNSFELQLDNVKDLRSGVKNVLFPVWSKADQSDIKWLQGVNVKDTNTWKVKVNKSEFNNANIYQAHVYTYDNVGNEGNRGTIGNIILDNTPPTISFNPNKVEWTKETVNVEMTATDSESGVKETDYLLFTNNVQGGWSGKSSSATRKITFASDGVYKIRGFASDKVGNEVTKDSGEYKVDKTKPGGSFSPNSVEWTDKNIETTFTPSDNLSGVKQWRYRLSNDGGKNWNGWSSYLTKAEKIKITSLGNWTIQSEIIDNASNSQTVTSGSFKIDYPDLTIGSLSVIDDKGNVVTNLVEGNKYMFKAEIKNLSNVSASTNTLSVRDRSSNEELGTISVGAISANGSKEVVVPMRDLKVTNTMPEKSLNVRGYIDYNNVISEKNETNNTADLNLKVYPKNRKPIAEFDVNPKIEDRDRPLTYKDTSYDSDTWDSIVERKWEWTRIKDERGNPVSEKINEGVTPPNSFNIYGTYQIRLRVRDNGNLASPSLWSDWSIPRNVEIKNLITVSAEIIPGEARQGQLVKLKIKTTYSPNKLFVEFPQEIIERSKENIKIDLNDDGVIDKKDITLLTQHITSKPGDPKWKAEFDLNRDGIIDKLDEMILSKSIGKEINELDKLKKVVELDIEPQDNSLTTYYEFYLPTNVDLTIDRNGNRVKDKYKFNIEAFRELDGEKANTSVFLDVKGSIYDGIRTRMK